MKKIFTLLSLLVSSLVHASPIDWISKDSGNPVTISLGSGKYLVHIKVDNKNDVILKKNNQFFRKIGQNESFAFEQVGPTSLQILSTQAYIPGGRPWTVAQGVYELEKIK